MKQRKTTKPKGLSDEQLVEKYGNGKAPFKTAIKRMLQSPSPGSDKRTTTRP